MPRYFPDPTKIVPDPANHHQPVPSSGIELPPIAELPQYWANRFNDGDITLETKPVIQAPEVKA